MFAAESHNISYQFPLSAAILAKTLQIIAVENEL
jgi:hypothetical protein